MSSTRQKCILLFFCFTLSNFAISATEGKEHQIFVPKKNQIFEGIKPLNKNKTTIAGIKLSSDYGFIEIIEYALVDSNILYVLGRTKSEELLLASIDLTNNKYILIKKYEKDFSYRLLKDRPSFAVFFLRNLVNSPPFIMLVYTVNNSGRRFDETETYVEVLKKETADAYITVGKQKIGEIDVALYRHTDKKNNYLYLALDDSKKGPGKISPAKKVIPKIILGEANKDGYTDIIIWRKVYLSRLIGDKDSNDFVLNNEEIQVMFFDYKNLDFLPMTEIDRNSLGKEKEILWKKLFTNNANALQ